MNLYMLAKKTNNVHFPHVGRMGRLLIPGKPPVEDASVLAVMIERLAPSGPLHDEVVDAARQYAWHHEKVDFISQEYPEFYAMERIFNCSIVGLSGFRNEITEPLKSDPGSPAAPQPGFALSHSKYVDRVGSK